MCRLILCKFFVKLRSSFVTFDKYVTSPSVGSINPAIRFNNVVFPLPDWPITPRMSPSSILRLTS
ncbi:hypothetical protein HOJ75_03800 [Candidatus Woesearchaeota archaeon]|nr:hypothetical protein [Candidatus Woesearchaeota archaeon]